MFEVMIESSFAAAHRLLNYEGACENMHGHNWKVQVFVRGTDLDKAGILVDYKILSCELAKIIDKLDHKDINTLEEFENISTSSELIARYIYLELKNRVSGLYKVSAWETDRAKASYWE